VNLRGGLVQDRGIARGDRDGRALLGEAADARPISPAV
jgi:hypothetical protein